MLIDMYYVPYYLFLMGLAGILLASVIYQSKKKKKKDSVWWGVRISSVIGIIAGATSVLPTYETQIQYPSIPLIGGVLIMISIIWAFVSSIIHLTKHKEKGFAISALVLSSMMILFGIGAGILGGVEPSSSLNDQICFDFCNQEIAYEDWEYYWYDEATYSCKCLNENEDIVRNVDMNSLT